MKKECWGLLVVLCAVAGSAEAAQAAGDAGVEAEADVNAAVDPAARKAELSALRRVLRAHHARWSAGETSNSRLTRGALKMRMGAKVRSAEERAAQPQAATAGGGAVPSSLDWRDYHGGNYVTPVKDQGNCGSCWAFATTAGLESYVLRTQERPGEKLDLSEHILIACEHGGDCSTGVYIDDASTFIESTGVPKQADYPYGAAWWGLGGDCAQAAADWQEDDYKIGRWYRVDHSVAGLKAALAAYGPLPTTMGVYLDFALWYTGGVYAYSGFWSGPKVGDHAVLIIGYDDAGKYFIGKNSWGSLWGWSGGYFKIAYSEVDSPVHFGGDTVAYSPALPLQVAVTEPSDGSVLSGDVAVSGTVSNYSGGPWLDVGVQVDSGEFVAAGQIDPVMSDATWSYTLKTGSLPPGQHTLTILAVDYGDNDKAQTSIGFTVGGSQ